MIGANCVMYNHLVRNDRTLEQEVTLVSKHAPTKTVPRG